MGVMSSGPIPTCAYNVLQLSESIDRDGEAKTSADASPIVLPVGTTTVVGRSSSTLMLTTLVPPLQAILTHTGPGSPLTVTANGVPAIELEPAGRMFTSQDTI